MAITNQLTICESCGAFPHCSNYLICFAVRFGSDSVWHDMERILPVVQLLAVVYKPGSDIGKEMLRSSAVDKVSCRIEVVDKRVRKRMGCSSGATFSTERNGEMERSRTSGSGKKRNDEAVRELRTRIKRTHVKLQVNWEKKSNSCDLLSFDLERI